MTVYEISDERPNQDDVLRLPSDEEILCILLVVHTDSGTRVDSLLGGTILVRRWTPKPPGTTISGASLCPFCTLRPFTRCHNSRNIFTVQPLNGIADNGENYFFQSDDRIGVQGIPLLSGDGPGRPGVLAPKSEEPFHCFGHQDVVGKTCHQLQVDQVVGTLAARFGTCVQFL